jgi:hypothetical protein
MPSERIEGIEMHKLHLKILMELKKRFIDSNFNVELITNNFG